MANQFVEINGERFGIWYQHSNIQDPVGVPSEVYEARCQRILEAYEAALEAEQIDVHECWPGPESIVDIAWLFNGVTVCYLEREDRSVAAVGYAFCSIDDNFNKALGRRISLSRAKHALSLVLSS